MGFEHLRYISYKKNTWPQKPCLLIGPLHTYLAPITFKYILLQRKKIRNEFIEKPWKTEKPFQ